MGEGLQNYGDFEDLCSELHVDHETKEAALLQYENIRENYTLEGDAIHWVACAVYEACRRRTLPTVGEGEMDGNPVSLTRLLRIAKLSLIQFFNKMKKWADMAHLPQSFQEKIEKIERNFSVSHNIFKKYRPIFLSVFKDPSKEPYRMPRSRKQRPKPCTVLDIYEFIWRMFVLSKVNFPNISDDLVNSYHLLLCVIDWVYGNAMLSGRPDLFCDQFSEHVEFEDSDGDAPCIIGFLCMKHDGIEVEAKGIKEHHFKNYLRRAKERNLLKGSLHNDILSEILDINYFDDNVKALDRSYEEYLLTRGDFDERIFLGRDADDRIGTPSRHPAYANVAAQATALDGPSLLLEAAARGHLALDNPSRSLCPKTPLTGRQHLPKPDIKVSPVSSATQGVNKLHNILAGRERSVLSEPLCKIFGECASNPRAHIEERIAEMGQTFCTAFTIRCNDMQASHSDFANKRLQSAELLYYNILENILLSERKRSEQKAPNKTPDLTSLLEQDIFHTSLFACCLEIVIFCYNSDRPFPWILAVFDISPYHFYKVIELLIRAEEGFSRDVVKHLNSIEECILDCLAWKADSPLWQHIEAARHTSSGLPRCEQVSLNTSSQIAQPVSSSSNHNQQQINNRSPLGSPVHPQIRRLAMTDPGRQLRRQDSPTVTLLSPPSGQHLGQSPLGRGPLASDRFSSPVAGTARRRLFGSTSSAKTSPRAGSNTSTTTTAPTHYITLPQSGASSNERRQILIPVQLVGQSAGGSSLVANGSSSSAPNTPPRQDGNPGKSGTMPKRTGSLALFFRKVYHLASVRLKDLCERLAVDEQTRRRIWTALHYCIIHETDLLKDRHLDQFVMCSIYAICKILGRDLSFQEIMRVYRLQPQAQSHVYRSVLLINLGASQSSSQATDVNSQASEDSNGDRIQERLRTLRSSSTLPLSQSSSAPPTPTRPSGFTSAVYDNEERGDLIKFYNSIFVRQMRQFIFSLQTQDEHEGPPLAELPSVRQHQTSPRRVSTNHSLYVSPHKKSREPVTVNTNMLQPDSNRNSLLTPHSRLLYCFNKSPARDLRAINNVIKQRGLPITRGEKRSAVDIESGGGQAIKQIKFAV